MTKEQEYEKEIERLQNEIKNRIAELKAKGIDPEEYIANIPMGTYVSSED